MINHISFPNLGISFDINRVAFSVFGVKVYTYGMLIALGLALAFWYAWREAKKTKITPEDFQNMFILGVPLAIICARAYYVIFEWDLYKDNLWEIFNLRGGGIAIYGAIIGAIIAVVSYCKVKKINVGTVLDILCIGLLIGQSIGRWGNFVNGEAFGESCNLPWAMTVVSGGRTVADMAHPTFFYESLWNALGILVLLFYKKKKRFEGELFCGYMVWYGLGRMFIEGLRTDSLYIGIFRVSQVLSFCILLAGAIIIILKRKNKKTLDKQ